MKIVEFLASLSWLLPSFLKTPADPPLKSLISEQHGQINCLEHNFLNSDVIRRHEAALFAYPEIRVGCETLSVKPFQRLLEPSKEPEDIWAFLPKSDKSNMKIQPWYYELQEKVQRYFVIDMNGTETQIQPGSKVTLETYDLSWVKLCRSEDAVIPSRLLTKLQTFSFDQLCFPVDCYEPGQEIAEECVGNSQWLSAEEAIVTITPECSQNPKKCASDMGTIALIRLSFDEKSGATLGPNITTYCSLETSEGPQLGPLRTQKYTGLQALLNDRSQVPSDTFKEYFKQPDDLDMRSSNFRTSVLLNRHRSTSVYKDQVLITSCIVTVPLEAPFNTSFAVDFFVETHRNFDQQLMRPGDRFKFDVLVMENLLTPDGGSLRYNHVVREVKFEELCFPAECYKERTPAVVATCQLQEPKNRKHQVPGTVLFYVNPSNGIQKLLWPTRTYDNKFFLKDNFDEALNLRMLKAIGFY